MIPRAGGFVEDNAPHVAQLQQASRCFREAASFGQQASASSDGVGGNHSPGSEVRVQVYELIQFENLHQLLAPNDCPFAGALHAGVEVYGREWSYGGGSGIGSGIICEEPRCNTKHRFRETVPIGYTKLSSSEVALVLGDLLENWHAKDYHWLRRNCLLFANEFCERLGVGRIPAWIDRLPRGIWTIDRGVRDLAEGTQQVMQAIVQAPANCTCRPLPTAGSSYMLQQSFVAGNGGASFRVQPLSRGSSMPGLPGWPNREGRRGIGPGNTDLEDEISGSLQKWDQGPSELDVLNPALDRLLQKVALPAPVLDKENAAPLGQQDFGADSCAREQAQVLSWQRRQG